MNDQDQDLTIEEVELYPPWKEALRTFQCAQYTYGDLIGRDWFARAFGLTPFDPNQRYTWKEVQTYDLAFLQNMTSFREALLETHQMDLVSDQRGSYIVMQPADQSDRAMRDFQQGMNNLLKKTMLRVRNVNTALLSVEDRQKHIDALTKIMDTKFRLQQRMRELPIDK